MPLGAILAATPEIGQREDTAHLKPLKRLNAKTGRQRDVKTAIAIEQRGVLAIQLQAFLGDQEHRDLRPILGLEEDLLRLEGIRLEVHLGALEYRRFAGRKIEAVHSAGIGEGREGVEALFIMAAPAETTHGAEGRQLDVPLFLAIQAEDFHFFVGIVHPDHDQAVVNEIHCPHHVFPLGNQRLPILAFGLVPADGHQLVSGRVLVGADVEQIFVIADHAVIRVKVIEKRLDGGSGLGEIFQENPVLGFGAFALVDQQPSAIFGDLRAQAPVRVVGTFVNQHVLSLLGPNFVEIDFLVLVHAFHRVARLRRGVSAVVEP